MRTLLPTSILLALAACTSGGVVMGETHSGQYHLGPVEWTGSFHNACAPYPAEIQALEGQLLAGLSNEVASTGNACDACLQITTGMGRTLVARAITYGVANAAGDVDLSQAAFDALHQGEYPRSMTWQFITCPGAGPLYFQLQAQANPDWTSLWVRNPRVPVDRLEVKSARHASFAPLSRGTDGTFTDPGGFGAGAFTLKVTGINGGAVEQELPGFTPGALVAGRSNLP
jgi:expansin (peptidoglycan-binding protein)